jgi:2-phosphosulfolactate phosphatase
VDEQPRAPASWHLQVGCDIRFEWGEYAAVHVAQKTDVAVIVDVLSFSTALDIACSRGAQVFPYRFKDTSAETFARRNAAVLAVRRGAPGYSLSPVSLRTIPEGTRLVLPSPNGSTLTLLCQAAGVVAGCLRNPTAIAQWIRQTKRPVTVIAAGERWPDGTLRPAIEDLIGAGAIISQLDGEKSSEALLAEAAWNSVRADVRNVIRSCASGHELIEQGYADDVDHAVALESSVCVPVFRDGSYRRM